jgi:FkbM family methyltransferase
MNTPIFKKIPMTRIRIAVAQALYVVLRALLGKNKRIIQRSGVFYEVDLSEGIDLSLFLFGNFQSYVIQNKYFSLEKDAIVFDVGANVGSMALRFAQGASEGHVYAFEPTDYAFAKLQRNLSLNPKLAECISPVQQFLSDQSKSEPQIQAYASWKVDGSAKNSHPLHGGTVMPAKSVSAITLDQFCGQNRIQHIDLIKIDTDGHEYKVLSGAHATIRKFRPYIIFEIGGYVLEEQQLGFEQFNEHFQSLNYTLRNIKNGKKITLQNFSNQIPLRATTDIIAIPPEAPIQRT